MEFKLGQGKATDRRGQMQKGEAPGLSVSTSLWRPGREETSEALPRSPRVGENELDSMPPASPGPWP